MSTVPPIRTARPGKPVSQRDVGSASRPRYDSPVRRAQSARTRERIIAAGAALVSRRSMWDWSGVTIGAVAARAKVNRRTVYRHFANERELRDAVLQHLTHEAGVDFQGMRLEEVQALSAKIFRYVNSGPLEPWKNRDEAYHAAEQHRRAALIAAVGDSNPELTAADQRIIAALFDLLWGVDSLERLVSTWELEATDATRGLLWLIGLLQEAVGQGDGPEL